MSETNKTYRIKTKIGTTDGFINVDTNLVQDYDVLDILSVKISSSETYKLHNSNYGVVVGRVLANNGFGVPNAKISIFIEADSNDGDKVRELYPFTNTYSKNSNGVRYNLLPDDKVADCHQVVGTFPNKRYMLDNDVVLEVFDKYYKYTTRTNNAGDYLIMGVPVGTYTLHMDLDLSDCGILSQKPRDFVYKGYTIEQFENPSKFKEGKEYNELSQVFSQDQTVNVIPFWGNESTGEQIGITRADINIAFKFETTCVFIGSVISDNSSNGITKKCMATDNMGNMEEMTTGEGTIEMIRKTPSGEIEEFQVKGTQLIDGNGVWCYQIPMNLDYMMTDEYGNMVPTDDPEKGIPTRTSVRFRISMQDNEENTDNFFRAKVLVPHNPQFTGPNEHEEYDYEFGTYTKDESFRDLFWDNVYSVKSYIPRFQKRKVRGWRDKNFTGIKSCNFHGTNNPMPYNNIRIKLPLMFTIMCAIIKTFIKITGIFNGLICTLGNTLAYLGRKTKIIGSVFKKAYGAALNLKLNVLSEGLCPDLENWYFAPLSWGNLKQSYSPPNGYKRYNLLQQTLNHLLSEEDIYTDDKSIDAQNVESEDEVICLTTNINYLIACLEMNLAMEYRVINFDFYNDWINGTIYIPRFMRYVRPKRTFLGITFVKSKLKACMDDTKIFSKTRRYTQMCSMGYKYNNNTYTKVNNPLASNSSKRAIKKSNNFHKKNGFTQHTIFGRNGGICHEQPTSRKQYVYYMKPCEWSNKSKVNLFATDIILLGSLKDCDENGLPKAFRYLSSTSYIMPTNLALTNMESNGYLYANNKNTICAGQSNQILNDNSIDDIGVQMVSPNSGLSTELEVYANAKDNNIDTKYDGLELSDIIALTEAAGISWNYTGPGQGEIVEKNMYYPGGHFLGMSCTNSQTNIKSCVNLSRICEVGVTMSQRKEDIGEIDKENGKEVYYYTVPTGFISGNEIIGEDFRAMFATMNQNRLQATNINFETGYKYYDFDFVKPVNFNGVFHDITKKGSEAYYNTDITLPTESEDILEKHGISYQNRNNRADYDENESLHTQTRTIEDTSVDYYRFRFGLNNDNLSKNNAIHDSRFLTTKSGYKYLPQYENSYYFYFGMKAGVTAIDEFNKQFFSVCEPTVLRERMPSLNVDIDNIDLCQQRAVANVVVDNIEMPLQSIKLSKTTENGVIEINVTDKKQNEGGEEYRNMYSFNISDDFNNIMATVDTLSFGKYHLEIIDSNGVTLTKDFIVGLDLFKYNTEIYNFNVYSTENIIPKNITRDEYLGGYIKLSNITVDNNYREYITDKVTFIIKDNKKKVDDTKTTSWYNQIEEDGNLILSGTPLSLYVKKPNVSYGLYIKYALSDACNNKDFKEIFLENFIIKDGKTVGLNMGWVDVPMFLTISPSGTSTLTYPEEIKENEIILITSAITTDVSPLLLFGNEKWWPDENVNGYSMVLGAMDTGRDEFEKVQTHITNRFDDLNFDGAGGSGTGGGGSYISGGNQESGYTPSSVASDVDINSGATINQDNNSFANWIKRVSIYKGTTENETFSNNIFTTSGNKVLWGEPQRFASKDKDRYQGEIHCSENEITYTDFTLDDDASYYNTRNIYSAIGVDDDGVVSGDYFAKLVNGKISKNYCYGKEPISGSGYVFKSIPDGEIVYLTYNGDEINTNPRNLEDNKDNGVYYSSFIYPVIEKPISVVARFFIWDEYGIHFPENEDGVAEIMHYEMAGRTEMSIQNGIRYNGSLGTKFVKDNITYVSGVTVSNIHPLDFDNATKNKVSANRVSGMTVTTVINEEGEEGYVDAFKNGYAMGVSGITEVHYEITEGYPSISEKLDLSHLVNTVSDGFNYDSYFGDYATYEVKSGQGIEITLHGSGKGSGQGFICKQFKNDKYKLLDLSINSDGKWNNEAYIYYQERGGKQPIYHVLCYFDLDYLWEHDDGNGNTVRTDRHKNKVSSKDGELVIVRIGYYNDRMCNIRWSYKYLKTETFEDRDDNSVTEEIEYVMDECYDLRKDGGWSRGTIGDNKNRLSGIFDMLWGTDENDNQTFHRFVQPVPNYRMKTNMGNTNWYNTIIAHKNNYTNGKSTIKEADLKKDIFYYVDRMPTQTTQNGLGEATLFKIYPVLLPGKIEDDGIIMDLYAVFGEITGGTNQNWKGIMSVVSDNGNTVTANTTSFAVSYHIDHIKSGQFTTGLSATNGNDAINKLMIKYGNDSVSATNGLTTNNWSLIYSNADCVEEKDPNNNEILGYNVTYKFGFRLNDSMKDNGFNNSFIFYLTTPSQGEVFNINVKEYEKYLNVYEDSNFNINIKETFYDFINPTDSIIIYVGCKNINNETISINYSETDIDSAFTIQAMESFNTIKNEMNYTGRAFKVSIEPNLIPGDYIGALNFSVYGKDDVRYKASFNYNFKYSITGITVSPTTIRTYTTGPCSGQSITIDKSENLSSDIYSMELGGDLTIYSEDFGSNYFTPIKNKNEVYFKYDGKGLVPDAGKEYDYEVKLVEGSKEYKSSFVLEAYPYVELNITNMNETGFPDLTIGTGKAIKAGETGTFIPNSFSDDFKEFKLSLLFKDKLLKRLYYLSPAKIINDKSINEKASFIDALTNTGNTFTVNLLSNDYYNNLDDDYIKIPSKLQLYRVELGDKYKINVRSYESTDAGDKDENSVNPLAKLSNDTDSIGTEILGTTPFVINYANFNKTTDNIKLCISISSTKEVDYISVMYKGKEFNRIIKESNPTIAAFPYEISILELCAGPIGERSNDGYFSTDIAISIVYKQE